MAKSKSTPINLSRLDELADELEGLEGVATMLADRITGEGAAEEAAAFLLASRLKAVHQELSAMSASRTEVANG
ncbi:MAG: hypothetical protein WD051_08000 [Steroidobacteraceae bacterium]